MTRCESSPTISALEKIPRRKEYLLVLSDGAELRVTEEDVSRFSLAQGSELGRDLVSGLARAYEYSRAKASVLRLLKVRPRTEGELRSGLLRKGLDPAASARVVEELKRSGAVDDRLFARLWTMEKLSKGASGRRRILAELRAKQIDAATAEEELDRVYAQEDETEIARQIASRRLAKLGHLPADVKRHRIYEHLLRRGFDSDIAAQAVHYALRGSDVKGA